MSASHWNLMNKLKKRDLQNSVWVVLAIMRGGLLNQIKYSMTHHRLTFKHVLRKKEFPTVVQVWVAEFHLANNLNHL